MTTLRQAPAIKIYQEEQEVEADKHLAQRIGTSSFVVCTNVAMFTLVVAFDDLLFVVATAG